jgi:hypothetical protein
MCSRFWFGIPDRNPSKSNWFPKNRIKIISRRDLLSLDVLHKKEQKFSIHQFFGPKKNYGSGSGSETNKKKFTVCGEKKVGGVLALEPSDLVDLLLNLQGLEVVELRLVRLMVPKGEALILNNPLSILFGEKECGTGRLIVDN